MKKISLILVLIILTACQKQSQIDYAIVKGKITNKGELNNLTVTNTDRDFNYEIESSTYARTSFWDDGVCLAIDLRIATGKF